MMGLSAVGWLEWKKKCIGGEGEGKGWQNLRGKGLELEVGCSLQTALVLRQHVTQHGINAAFGLEI